MLRAADSTTLQNHGNYLAKIQGGNFGQLNINDSQLIHFQPPPH
jgi:hypothetical protein